MDTYLDSFALLKLNQEDRSHVNRSIINKVIEAEIKSLPQKKKNPGLDGFSAAFYQTFKGDLTLVFLKLFHKIEREGTLPNFFCETSINLILKHNKRKFGSISLMKIDVKIVNKILAK
jgi:hypothetical protein